MAAGREGQEVRGRKGGGKGEERRLFLAKGENDCPNSGKQNFINGWMGGRVNKFGVEHF